MGEGVLDVCGKKHCFLLILHEIKLFVFEIGDNSCHYVYKAIYYYGRMLWSRKKSVPQRGRKIIYLQTTTLVKPSRHALVISNGLHI